MAKAASLTASTGKILVGTHYTGGSKTARAGWFRSCFPHGELYSLVWEPAVLEELGKMTTKFFRDYITSAAVSQLVARTVLGSLMTAITLPGWVVTALDKIDSPWAMAVDRAKKAGIALGDALLAGAHGRRPITLIGWGMGARVIFKALEHMSEVAETRAAEEKKRNSKHQKKNNNSKDAGSSSGGSGMKDGKKGAATASSTGKGKFPEYSRDDLRFVPSPITGAGNGGGDDDDDYDNDYEGESASLKGKKR